MKRKWNWLDTVIVCIAVVLVVGVCIFLFRPSDNAAVSNDETDYYITFDTDKAKVGTFDAIKAGDTVYTIANNKEFGVIETVEILPSQAAVFNEETKQYELAENAAYPFCRITVKTTGYKNDSGAVYAKNRAVLYDDDWNFETDHYRFNARVTGVKGAEQSK